MCLARTEWDAPQHRGLTWFSVPTSAEGVDIRRILQIDGSSGFCEEFLDHVAVGDEDLIGDVNHGWAVAQTMLVYERGAGEMGASTLPPTTLAPDLVALARTVGRIDDPAARQLVAKGHINDCAQYFLGQRLRARLQSSATPDPAVAAYGKLAAGTLTPARARLAVDIGGPNVMAWAAGDEQGRLPAINYLNGRMQSIAAGSNEMQRNGIGERVLGLPREPTFDSNTGFSDVLRKARSWDSRVG
jgi:alkylation response protein AidB-like acyl-CoA dehydrogenase